MVYDIGNDPIGGRKVRWWLYNLTFRIFGKTKVWPKLGFVIWN